MIRVELPAHLCTLAGVRWHVDLDVPAEPAPTVGMILDALEARYPMLRGTIRDHGTLKRRPFLRFFACGEDLSLLGWDAPVPAEVARGEKAFMVVGAIAGG